MSLVASVPSIVIPLGVKSLLSLGGITTLGLGVWHVDRTWDEKGSKAFQKAYEAAKSKDKKDVTIPKKDLDASFPFPIGFIAGWTMYAASNLFPSTSGGWSPSSLAVTTYGAIAAGASMALSYIASIPMGEAVMTRNAGMKQKLSMAFVGSWAALTYATTKSNPEVSPAFCIAGAISIIASMKILWKNRKMGDSWEQEGKPNPNPHVYNFGGPLFVFGWFLYWIGLCGTNPGEAWTGAGLPLYFDVKTLLAFLCGCGMVPVVLVLDYAHDEGAEYTGFGTDGRFYGRFLESPIPFLLAWAGFGASAMVSAGGAITTKAWSILANCVAQGVDAGLLIQTALYEGDMARKNKWSIPFVGLFMALAANIGWGGGLKLAFALPGAVLIIAGQKTVFGDRKRGDYFMQNNKKENPNPIVYSYGEPLFMTGWILISWGMSLVGRE